MDANTAQSTQPENWSASFSLRPVCDNKNAWSTLVARKTKVLSKCARRACNAGQTYKNSGIFYHEGALTTQETRTFNLLSMYVLTQRELSALPPCVYFTSKVRGEYFYSTCGVRHDSRGQQDRSASQVLAYSYKF